MTPAKSSYPFVGAWKLTACESSHPPLPHPQSALVTFTQSDGDIHYEAETTCSNGRTTNSSTVFQPDGAWSPLIGGTLADSVSIRVLDDGSLESKLRNGDAEIGGDTFRVSDDGQTAYSQWEILVPGSAAVTWKITLHRQ